MADQLVEQAGLAHVGAAEERHPAGAALGLVRFLRCVWQRVEHHIQQVAAASPVQRADRGGLAETQRPQRRDVGLGLGVIDLVGRDHDRLARPAQHPGHRRVGVGHPDGGVHHEQHGIGGLDRDPGLGGDPRGQALRALRGSQPPVSTTVNDRPRHIAS